MEKLKKSGKKSEKKVEKWKNDAADSSNSSLTDSTEIAAVNSDFYSIAKTLLEGVYDDGSILSSLRGIPHLVRFIFDEATREAREQYWRTCIKLPNESLDQEVLKKKREKGWFATRSINDVDAFLFYTQIFYKEAHYEAAEGHGHGMGMAWAQELTKEEIEFPSPADIKVNMMPFILGQTFKECKLPKYLQEYWPLIQICSKPEASKKHNHWFSNSELGQVCFLTVHESFVEAGKSHRRAGMHTDNPGKVLIRRKPQQKTNAPASAGNEGIGVSSRFKKHCWGLGGCHIINNINDRDGSDGHVMVLRGGIYMASTVDDTCEVWNCKIMPDSQEKEIIGKLGDVEHLRKLMPSGEKMKANRMYWMTDRTPHECLPIKEGTYRQFFRLVTSQVSLWYEDHSTKNPLGVVPNPSITKIVKGSKFDKDGVEEVDDQYKSNNNDLQDE